MKLGSAILFFEANLDRNHEHNGQNNRHSSPRTQCRARRQQQQRTQVDDSYDDKNPAVSSIQ